MITKEVKSFFVNLESYEPLDNFLTIHLMHETTDMCVRKYINALY